MDESEPVPTTEDHPVITVTVPAMDGLVTGARVSLDYAGAPGGGIEVTWIAPDPAGRPMVTVWLENPSRPDLPT